MTESGKYTFFPMLVLTLAGLAYGVHLAIESAEPVAPERYQEVLLENGNPWMLDCIEKEVNTVLDSGSVLVEHQLFAIVEQCEAQKDLVDADYAKEMMRAAQNVRAPEEK